MRRRWKYRVADLFLRFYTRKYGRLCSRNSFDASENFNKITIFSSTALGDFLLNTPAIKAIRRRYPAAEITLVANAKNRTLVERDESGLLYDRVVYWNNKLQTVRKLVRELTANGPSDLTVILHSHGPYDVVAAVMAGSRYIFRDNLMKMNCLPQFNRWLTNYVTCFYGHYITRKLALVSSLGAPTDDSTMCLPFSVLPGMTMPETLLIGIQMGTARLEKNWPVPYYAKLSQYLLEAHPEVKIVLIGAANEKALSTEFMHLLPTNFSSRVLNTIGNTTLRELASMIASMNLLVTGDTGPLHIAVALHIKTISLFIHTDPRETAPYQDKQVHIVLCPPQQIIQVEQEPFQTQGIIKPEVVFDHIEKILF